MESEWPVSTGEARLYLERILASNAFVGAHPENALRRRVMEILYAQWESDPGVVMTARVLAENLGLSLDDDDYKARQAVQKIRRKLLPAYYKENPNVAVVFDLPVPESKRGYRLVISHRPSDSSRVIPSVVSIPSSLERHVLDAAIAAWRNVHVADLYDFLVEWYRSRAVPLFSYMRSDGTSTVMPLYVRSSWVDLRDNLLNMTRTGTHSDVALSKDQQEFRDLYPVVREKLGLKPLFNKPLFRLVELFPADPKLTLRFEEGLFLDAFACQYILEHEARMALADANSLAKRPGSLPIRESLAATAESIEQFCQTQVVRIGISNLMLLRQDESAYRVLIRARGEQSLVPKGYFDPMTSGIFDISTANPAVDFSLEYQLFIEVYEELFGGKEVEKEIAEIDPYFFYNKPGIADLKTMIDDHRASFQVTGFCIDLVHIIPEITTVTVVRDESYFSAHSGGMQANTEYGASFRCEIPRDLSDVDGYLATEFPANPARPDERRGFDPMRWTLPGGFCFQQGLKRAVHDKLL